MEERSACRHRQALRKHHLAHDLPFLGTCRVFALFSEWKRQVFKIGQFTNRTINGAINGIPNRLLKGFVVAIEQAESKGSITLNSLEKAAQALDCRLVYALVPGQSLEQMVKKRASLLAKNRLKSASHTMALEAQGVEAADENEQLKRLIRQLIEKPGSKLWEKDA